MKKMSIYAAILSSLFSLGSKVDAQDCGGNFTQYQVLSRNNGENFRQFADINGDGLTDLITQDNGTIARFYLNTGTGFTAAGSLQLPSFGNVVAAKDFDNDGRVDLLSNSITGTNCLSNQIRIFWNTGQNNAFFSTGLSTNLPLPVNPYCMQSQDIDFNGDGLLDIIATSMPFSPSTNSPGRTYLNNGNRNFSVAADFLWPRDLYGTYTRDFNGDGNADFLVTIKDGWADGLRGMYYYRGNGNGTFQAPIVNFNSAPLAAGGIPIQADPINNNTEDVLMSLNGVSPATMKLGRWNGSNNFAFSDISIPTGFATSQAFDFDLDGKQDIMLLSTNGQNILRWMTGNGNGAYNSNTSNILQANGYNLSTMFKDANVATQYISGSNASSLIVYRRSVSQTTFITENISVCGPYTWNGNTYSQSGTFIDTLFTSVNGCDSIVATLNLTINQPSASTVNATITEGETYSFNGQNLTAAGTYTATLQNAAGCDSVVTLNLSVNPVVEPLNCEITASETSICAGGIINLTALSNLDNQFSCGYPGLSEALSSNLIAFYPFCGNTNDVSSNQKNGTIVGTLNLTEDRFGNENSAYSFNSGNGFIQLPYVQNNLRTFSVSLWFKTTSGGWIFRGSRDCNGGVGSRLNISCSGSVNTITYGADDNGYLDGKETNATYSDNQWHHVVGIWDGNDGTQILPNQFTIYVDGIVVDQTNATSVGTGGIGGHRPIPMSGSAFCALGQLTCQNGCFPFEGDLDDVFIFERALNQSDVQSLFNFAPSSQASILWSNGETTPSISASPTETTTYSVTVNQGGQTCTSEVTITVNQPSAETVTATITEGETYSFNGQSLITAGTYTATLQNAAGCDSVVTLNLTVEPAVVPLNCTISANRTSVCAGESVNLILEGSTANSICSADNLPANLQQGLVAWYPFCGNANDGSGNGNDGIVNGAELSQDRFGNTLGAYQFNGLSDYIEIPNSEELNFSNQYSISVWVKIPDYSTNSGSERPRTMISKPRSSGGTGYAFRSIEGIAFGGQNPSTYTSGWNNSIVNSTIGGNQDVLPLDTWSHIVFSYDGSEAKLYRDGSLINSRTTSFVLNNSQTSLFLGKEFAFNNEFSRWFKGTIDEVALYNRALTFEDVQTLYGLQSLDIVWSSGETTPSISVSPIETTTYSVTVTQGAQTCTSEVTITVNQPTAATVNAAINEGETYSFNSLNLTATGTYSATLQNAAGCDSVVTLNLTVTPAPVSGCYAASVVNFIQGDSFDGTTVSAIRSNAEHALGMPEPVVTNVVNFVSLGFGGSITLAFEAPIANGAGNDIRIDEATWGNNPCNRYPERADVFASQDGVNFVYLGVACQDASFDLGALSWAQYVRIVDISDLLSFSHDADGFDVNGIECLNGAATSLNDDGLVACSLQEIVSYTPGNRKNGTPVASPRNNPANALGTPQNNNTINFTALGFGGTVVAKFDFVVFNQTGNDLRVTETSFGNPSCNNYPEKARVSVSMDNVNWTELGEICQDGEIDLGNVNYAQYIKIQDASPISSNKFNGAADGYDVDAVMVLNNGCGTSSARLAQVDNTTTPDASMSISAFPNPMEDYTIVNFEGLENDAEFTFQIMDAAGRVIRNNNIRISTANPTYLFDASELARGIYQVLISNENGSYIVRLVK